MSSYRLERLQEEIQHAVSSIILFDLTDPLVRGATITRVLITKDLSAARVYYDFKGPEEDRALLQRGFDRAKGFIRKQLAPQLRLKGVPGLEFFYDETKDEIDRVNELFAKI